MFIKFLLHNYINLPEKKKIKETETDTTKSLYTCIVVISEVCAVRSFLKGVHEVRLILFGVHCKVALITQ